MKKTLFNLQLFADEAETSTETGTEQPTTEEKAEGKAQQQAEKKSENKAEEKVFTHADFDRLFSKKYAELEQKKQKEIDEAKKLAEMNAEEKANYKAKQETERADKAEARVAELERKDALNEMSKTARKMLADEGISIPDDLLSRLVTTDAEETKSAVDGFAKLFKDSVEAAVKEKLRGETPKAGTSGGAAVSEIDKRIEKYKI